MKTLNESQRLAILRFKHLAIERQLKVSGMFIYDAVLRGITEEQAFLEEVAHRS